MHKVKELLSTRLCSAGLALDAGRALFELQLQPLARTRLGTLFMQLRLRVNQILGHIV